MAQKDVTQENMTQLNAADHSAAYTAQDRWLKMPMAEYIVSYRDSARVRGYCRECGRYGNCWACPPYDFDETALLEQSVPAHTARAFFAGTCRLCPPEHCTRRDSLPCRHLESIRPSLEALGFDVTRTTSGLFGIDLQWGRPDAPPACLTLLSALACSRQQHTRV